MNSTRFKFVFPSAVCVALVSAAVAQDLAQVPPTSKGSPVQVQVDVTAVRLKLDEARSLAKGNNLTAAEQILVTLNRARPNTAAWHIETAQRLLMTAEQMSHEGKTSGIAPMTASALAHLTQAETSAPNIRTRISAKTLIGFVHERYLADPKSALASYQSAAALAPSTSTRAKEAADRLQRGAAARSAKSPGTGN